MFIENSDNTLKTDKEALFDKMIYMSRPESIFPKMSMNSRASQFLAFDALDGFSYQVKEIEKDYND